MADKQAIEKKKYTRMDFTSDQSVSPCAGVQGVVIMPSLHKHKNYFLIWAWIKRMLYSYPVLVVLAAFHTI